MREPIQKPRFPWWLGVIVALVAVAIVLTGVWLAIGQNRHGRELVEDDLLAIGHLKAGQIAVWRAERLGDAAVIAATPSTVAMVERWLASGTPRDDAEVSAWFEALKQEYGYSNVQLVDPAGIVLLGPAGDGPVLMPDALGALQTALNSGKAVLTDLHFGTDGATIHLDGIAPLFGSASSGGQALGAVILTADASDFLFPLIQTWPTASPSAETLLVERQDENVIYLNELRHQKGTALALSFPLTQTSLPAVMAVTGAQGIVEGTDYRGAEVLAAVQGVQDSPWFIVAKIDIDEAFGGEHVRTVLVILVCAFLLAALAATTALMWQRVLKQRYQQAYDSEIARKTLLARYEHIVQQANDIILLSDESGRVVEANARAVETYGYPREELVGLEITQLVPPEGLPAFEDQSRGLREIGSFIVEAMHQRRDGSVFPVEISARTIVTEGKTYLQAIVRDLTERNRAETLLRLIQFSVDHAADSVFWTDADGRLLFVSDSTCRRHGYSREELLAKTLFDIDPSLTREQWARNWQALRSGETLQFETIHRTKDGEVFPVEVHGNYVEFDGREYNCVFARDITERKQAENALVASEVGYRRLFEAAQDGILILDGESGEIKNVNPFLEKLLGYSHEQLVGRRVWELGFFRDAFANQATFDELKAQGYVRYEDLPLKRADGAAVYVEFVSNVYDVDHRKVVQCNIRDMTDRREMEESLRERDEQLRQAQKMEAVGQLAGGIAHDFNNLLTAILGYGDLLLANKELTDTPARADLEEIKRAAQRAATLTGQILAFSRRQTLRPQVVSLNEVLNGMAPLLRRTLGEDIDLVSHPALDLGLVEVDLHQFEQVLMNLALNARDAMTSGGRLTLETANAELDDEYCRTHPEVAPGSYVMLAVSDTGLGMDEATRLRVFEPFYTTKGPGEGTGLGLATVYGTVKQSYGSVSVYSEPGKGTTFKIYLPRTVAPVTLNEPVTAGAPRKGHETVLVVEDEEALRNLAARVLTDHGYKVLTAGTAAEALQVVAGAGPRPEILVTDLVLPGGMQGKELAQSLLSSMPGLPVLYMSGYTRNAIVHAGRLDAGVHFIEKPFTPAALAAMVWEVLDHSARQT